MDRLYSYSLVSSRLVSSFLSALPLPSSEFTKGNTYVVAGESNCRVVWFLPGSAVAILVFVVNRPRPIPDRLSLLAAEGPVDHNTGSRNAPKLLAVQPAVLDVLQ